MWRLWRCNGRCLLISSLPNMIHALMVALLNPLMQRRKATVRYLMLIVILTGCSGSSSSGGTRPGDWICQACGANVFASKDTCFKCQAPKPVQTYNRGGPGVIGVGLGSGGDVRPGDWTCPNCSANVFASKNTCFRCHTPKPEGGFMGPVTCDPRSKSL